MSKKDENEAPKEKKEKKKKRKNANGEGSIFKCEKGKFKGQWMGQLTIGTNPETGRSIRKNFLGSSMAEVKEKMKPFREDLAKGIDLQNNLTFGSWIVTWMEDYKKLDIDLSTWENYDRSIKNHAVPELGHILLKNLVTDDIQALYTKMIKDGSAPATVRRNHQIINGCLEQAAKNRKISWNPAKSVVLPKLEDEEARAMTVEEMNIFLAALNNIKGPHKVRVTWRTIFLTLLGTGIRSGEALALRWPRVDIRNRTATVTEGIKRTKEKGLVFGDPKTAKSKRTVPIPDEVAFALRLQRIHQAKVQLAVGESYSDQALVFSTSKGTPINPRNLIRKFHEIRKAAGLSTDITVHSLRHTFATRMLERGESLKTVQELLGHADIATTGNTYAHVMPEVKVAAGVNMNGLLKKDKKISSQKERILVEKAN
ncbi:MAG: site-specific integrase [Desulfosporosinus sp.]|nr:site-specific integrase [Desulfosporosinus sp.]